MRGLSHAEPPVVLVADGEVVSREYIGGLVRGCGWSPVLCASADEALRTVEERPVDLVLLGATLPGLGVSTGSPALKERVDTFLPVVLVLEEPGPGGARLGVSPAADDFLVRPFHKRELIARVTNLLALKDARAEVARLRDELRRSAIHDELTGLVHHRHFMARLGEELKRAERHREPLACLLLDVDGLDAGRSPERPVGNEVLRELAKRLRDGVRGIDVAGRSEDDALALMLPCTPLFGAITVAERLLHRVTERPYVVRAGGGALELTVHCSLGVSVYPSRDVHTKEELLGAARNALVEAASNGSGRICAHQHQGYLFRRGN
ncbi:MAG: diguanylate cyclase [Myxococcota bacterium]